MSVAAPEPSAPFGHWAGGQITEHAHCLLQGNPGPMTLDGTNTWVLREPGARRSVVIDPGPADGIIGANTRKAIRALQLQLNWPADGYPNTELLQQLRAR